MTISYKTINTAKEARSLVIPLYNEREAIVRTVTEAHCVLRSWGGEYEIVVVDDGSTDGSADALRESELLVHLLTHKRNRGYGAALKSGFAAAKYDLLAFVDADGSYPISELPTLIEAAADADMVVGARQRYANHASLGRRFAKATILVPLAQYLTGRNIPDINSGMRVVRRKLVERYWSLIPDGFSLTTTLTMAFLSAGWRVRYLPIEYTARTGKSKIRPLRDISNFIILILRTVTYFNPLKVYLPLSAGLIASSIAVVLVSKKLTGEVMDVTSLFLFIAGLQMLLIGVVADLIFKLLGTRE